jgi:hypothetical protein
MNTSEAELIDEGATSTQASFILQARSAGRRIQQRWTNYLFRHDASLSLGIVRIAVGLSVLWLHKRGVPRDFHSWLPTMDPRAYNPKGILALFGNAVPDPAFFEWARQIALASTIGFTIGFLTRASLVISLTSNLIVAGALESFITGWSHGKNIVLLVMIALLCAPGAQALSIDRLLRARKDKSLSVHSSIPGSLAAPPILLAQVIVGLMFFNAAFWKFRTGNYTLDWALSDNFRNVLLARYPMHGEEMPGYLQWVADHAFAYKSLALGNLIFQAAPILACFFIRRPLLRAVLGLAFVADVIGLGVVMSLWNLPWLLLYAVFVDWDALLRRDRTRDASSEAKALPGPVSHYFASVFVLSVVAFSAIVAFFLPRGANFELNAYPFSQFKMYSDIKAKQPYDSHLPYEVVGVTFGLESDVAPRRARKIERLLQRRFFQAGAYLTFDEIESRLGSIRGFLRERMGLTLFRLSMYRTVFKAPPYPAKAKLRIVHRGLMALTDSGGREAVVFAKHQFDPSGRAYLETRQVGYADPEFEFGYILDLVEAEKPLPGTMIGNRYYYLPPETGRYLIVTKVRDRQNGTGGEAVYMGDMPFHVASH